MVIWNGKTSGVWYLSSTGKSSSSLGYSSSSKSSSSFNRSYGINEKWNNLRCKKW